MVPFAPVHHTHFNMVAVASVAETEEQDAAWSRVKQFEARRHLNDDNKSEYCVEPLAPFHAQGDSYAASV
ncbi:uncharacterized protein PITG_18810 [Phytophthora infestans T30-4]|uniref:Uncharacterized protein n=1 Tax=Phytophthora infestans (strain T30-4) TaxID=403677 RepID=D0NZG0_PHYIT|nr:uncharacterized protein PITG_18810 [Phytophthora infestans T30-4]EEY69514.1 hypothetical protein PITG_18810 [Phytophthora infestans T30-4]|eukprot:XP_002997281.1 hypothetical protein PITG_18810 [Phytophthora infestans T30-4]